MSRQQNDLSLAVALVAACTAACSGGKPAEPDEPKPEAPAPTMHPPAPGSPIDVFHTALAPRWHAVGPTRMKSTCAALPELTTKLKAVRAAGPPPHLESAVWSPSLTRLETGLANMKAPCSGTDTTKFEAAFSVVHAAFHEHMDIVVGEHGHGEGDGRGGMRGIPR